MARMSYDPHREKIAALYEAGWSPKEIAGEIGGTIGGVQFALIRFGVVLRSRAGGEALAAARARLGRVGGKKKGLVLDPVKDDVIAFYRAGNSLEETASHFNAHSGSVKLVLERYGVPCRTGPESARLRESKKPKDVPSPGIYGEALPVGGKPSRRLDPAAFVPRDGEPSRACPRCKRDVALRGWHLNSEGETYKSWCKVCFNEDQRSRYDPAKAREQFQKDKEKARLRTRRRYRELRREVLDAYGHRCACCGVANAEFLAVDHTEGGGASHRAYLRSRGILGVGHGFHLWLKQSGFPNSFRLLCHNCNSSMSRYGGCPHAGELPAPDSPGRAKRRRMQLRRAILDGYGRACACCGESHAEFLAVDHVNGGGARHFKELRKSGRGTYGFYEDIIAAGFPADYRLLCHNCNFSRGRYGHCPHQGVSIASV